MRSFATPKRALLALIAGATLSLAACSMDGMDHGNPSPSNIPSGAAFNATDVQFAQQMIPHHAQAVEMATLAETRAADPELKALAVQIKAAQDPEIITLRGWLTGWGQPTAQPGGHNMPGMSNMPGMMAEQEMAQLKVAQGVEFDRMFARMMIAHHNGAIQMAREEQAKGSSPDAKRLALAIEQAQTTEIGVLQQILDRLK